MNKVILSDSRNMRSHVPDGCVHLIVTSPPQDLSAGHRADENLDNYLRFLGDVFSECRRVLCSEGRLCINVAGVGGDPYVPLHSHIERQLMEKGWLICGTVIWNKPTPAGESKSDERRGLTGTPVIREVHEHILVFSKEDLPSPSFGGRSNLTEEEFAEFTGSVWTFPPESPKRLNHPSPFPEELPRRLIMLYSKPGDLILDPFVGSGTTCVVAKKLGRRWLGIDNNPDYVLFAHERIQSTAVESVKG